MQLQLGKEVDNRDIFENTDYKAFFEDSITEEWEDFVYLISRGKYDEVLETSNTMNFPLET